MPDLPPEVADGPTWQTTLRVVGSLLLLLLFIAGALIVYVRRQLHAYEPRNADEFWTTLRAVPFALCLAVDVLDLALDFFSAPIVWVLLGKFKARALRYPAVIQALIPGTQIIPALSVLWVIARVFRLGQPPPDWQQELDRRPM